MSEIVGRGLFMRALCVLVWPRLRLAPVALGQPIRARPRWIALVTFLTATASTVALAATAATARADIYEGTTTSPAPAQPPSFEPEAPITQQSPYARALAATYDEDAGSLRITLGFYEPDYWYAKAGLGLAYSTYSLGTSCERLGSSAKVVIEEQEAAPGEAPSAVLTVSGTRGSLHATATYANGAYSIAFANPGLAGLGLRCLGINRRDLQPAELNDVTLEAERAQERGAFTSRTASAALRSQIVARFAGATFPAREGATCPELYPEEVTGGLYSVCFVEFSTGRIWHLVSTGAHFEHGAITFPEALRESRWKRRWVRCSLRTWHIPGTLWANNGCTRGPQSDGYFIAIEASPKTQHRMPRRLGWQFTESAGFDSIGIFTLRRTHGQTYTYTNIVGDSFRYTR